MENKLSDKSGLENKITSYQKIINDLKEEINLLNEKINN